MCCSWSAPGDAERGIPEGRGPACRARPPLRDPLEKRKGTGGPGTEAGSKPRSGTGGRRIRPGEARRSDRLGRACRGRSLRHRQERRSPQPRSPRSGGPASPWRRTRTDQRRGRPGTIHGQYRCDQARYCPNSVAHELASVAARKATLLDPTAESEVAQVLRRRLFSRIDDAGAAEVVDAYRALWTANADSLPPTRPGENRSEGLLRGYPFHPGLLAVLTDKVFTLTNFQRVRGMLRLVTQTVANPQLEVGLPSCTQPHVIGPFAAQPVQRGTSCSPLMTGPRQWALRAGRRPGLHGPDGLQLPGHPGAVAGSRASHSDPAGAWARRRRAHRDPPRPLRAGPVPRLHRQGAFGPLAPLSR
jgi:hypothetical protein